MNILGIETSCDETSAGVVVDGRHVLSNVISSQLEVHQPYGGIVPELAARAQITAIIPVVEEALSLARVPLAEIDVIAVTNGPGLAGSLLVGVNFLFGGWATVMIALGAKGIANVWCCTDNRNVTPSA